MAETVELKAAKRKPDEVGTRAARRLRAGRRDPHGGPGVAPRVPAVLYGHKQETVGLTLPAEDIIHAIRHGHRFVDLKIDGQAESALIADVQWDHLGKEVLHVDFKRVSRDERIRVTVPVELRGIAPGVSGGGVLDQPLHTLHVECLPTAVPEHIRVAIGELQQGAAIHVRELHLPEGVVVLDDPEAIVVQVRTPVAAPEPTAAPAPGTAEPEVIGRKAAEEGEGEGE
jgi:large subunit ribosomal protein L25